VAVSPFRALGDDQNLNYFSSGITSNLISDLSRFHDLFVPACNWVFPLREEGRVVQDIGQELGVR
jgi:adenylate cyclase